MSSIGSISNLNFPRGYVDMPVRSATNNQQISATGEARQTMVSRMSSKESTAELIFKQILLTQMLLELLEALLGRSSNRLRKMMRDQIGCALALGMLSSVQKNMYHVNSMVQEVSQELSINFDFDAQGFANNLNAMAAEVSGESSGGVCGYDASGGAVTASGGTGGSVDVSA